MNKLVTMGIAVSLLLVLGFAKPSFAQPAINSATMTLIDNDGNGYANIGDEIEISVVVDDAVSGTSVRIFNNDIFPGAGPFNLTKVSTGFGNGIEYSLTLPIIQGTTHNGEDPGDVNFTIQVRLGGVTQDDQTDLNLSGIAETIDNVLPTVSNSVFDNLGAAVLVTGDAFELSIDATDDSGIGSITADLRRLGLGEEVSIPFDAGNTYTLDTEEIQQAQNQDQVSLNDSRSIVFTVTDEAGNSREFDSAEDAQTQNVDNVTPSAPVVVAVQRASDFNNSQDMFDVVITNGEDPLFSNGDPVLDENDNVITFESLMTGGNYDIYWNGGDGI
ncbi:MAG: hypothetical protein LAT57_09155, partial [Balneolales bacterium]|nr:hypothetical protein [Balneolales bacterium]